MTSFLAVSLVAILSSYGLATTERDCKTTDKTHDKAVSALRQDSGTIGTQHQESLIRASKLIGKPVKNLEGKTIGTVYDLVLTPDLDGISYLALSRGGLFGVGRNLHAVPWSAVQFGMGERIMIPADKYELRQARGFNEIYWPSEGNPQWTRERTWSASFGAQTMADREEIQNRRFSRIMRLTVDDAQGRSVGAVRDLVVAADSGRIAYTIVSHGGLLGLGSRWTAVPAEAITFLPDRRFARLDVDRRTLVANSFNPAQMPNLSDPTYTRDTYVAFHLEPGTTVLGYVAPEEPAAAPMAERLTTQPAGPSEAELIGTFDRNRISTFEGTVTDLGKYKCSKTGIDVLWLKVKTDDGRIITVNAGPRDHIAKQDFYVVGNDRIRLTGSDVASTAAGKRVLLPTEIVFGTHSLRLVDADNRPLWESYKDAPGQQPATTTDLSSADSSDESWMAREDMTEEYDSMEDEMP